MKKVVTIVAVGLLALGALVMLATADDGLELIRYDAQGNELERKHLEPGDFVGKCGYDELIDADPCEKPPPTLR